MTHIETLQT